MTDTQTPALSRSGTVGLGLTALATLMFEILLTRVFSVTMFYHFAFLAISVAMFGMTVGALLVYLAPGWFAPPLVKRRLAVSTLLFGWALLASHVAHLRIRVPLTDLEWNDMSYSIASLRGAAAMTATYVIVAIPFILSGVAVCLSLTRFPRQVSRLYAADLVGAAAGCLLVVLLLNAFGDISAVILAVAALALAGAACFAIEARSRSLIAVCAASCGLCAAGVVLVMLRPEVGRELMGVRWVKGELEPPALYERWNSFARVRVSGDPDLKFEPWGWGISEVYPARADSSRLDMNIDGTAYTPITRFDGDLDSLDYLRYDATNIVHVIRPSGPIAIIGAGGGRDVLSALVFGHEKIRAIEMNGDILSAVTEEFADFAGHLDEIDQITFVNDEARSYLTGTDESFDVIQASLVDTWAATAAGAFVLAENSLYTLEAWKTFLEKLTPTGVLTFSRFYPDGVPGEMYRMMSLAARSLDELGVAEPERHVAVIRHVWPYAKNRPSGIGTILVGRAPLTDQELDALESECARLEFEIVYSPRLSTDPVYESLIMSRASKEVLADLPLDVSPTTDNRPFFFQMLRFRDLLKSRKWYQGALTFNMKAVSVLALILVIVLVLTTLCVFVPLVLTRRRVALGRDGPLLGYFAAIGLGFMLVEIAAMQRLVVFLGHPVYGLSVVLFTMLLASGLGSFATQNVSLAQSTRPMTARLGALLIVLVAAAIAMPWLMTPLRGASAPIRIAVAVAMLAPLGLLMGMAFPLGMKLAAERAEELTPWLWGVNGATSIFASVLAVVISLAAGITATFWVGVACYVGALLFTIRARRQSVSTSQP